jgi:hypothetical protein
VDDYDKAMADVVDAVKMMVSSWCHADSPKAMPERAQRINGHNNYRCVLQSCSAGSALKKLEPLREASAARGAPAELVAESCSSCAVAL